MKLLIVAHPDDCVLWFNPKLFDKIVICLLDRFDNYDVFKGRLEVQKKHPLKDKIVWLGLTEDGYYQNKLNYDKHCRNYDLLKEKLANELIGYDEIHTHNSWGEYGHTDHIMVNQIVRELSKVPVWCFDGITPSVGKERREEEMDIEFFKKVRELYKKNNCWTWKIDYYPTPTQMYYNEKP
jgi:hypothetical protein